MEKAARAILSALASPDGELSILIVDDPQIEKLNREHLKRTGPTNVIAFSMREGEFSTINPQLLGDVVISVETAEKEAIGAGISTETRLYQLLVHGILHLFGFDHEKSDREAARMEEKATALLGMIESINE